MAKKQKFYVVWKGKRTGIFESWDDCNAQIKGFKGAQYKSFSTFKEAKEAFEDIRLERDWMKEFSFKIGEGNVCVPLVVCFPLIEEYEKWSIVPMLRESTVST